MVAAGRLLYAFRAVVVDRCPGGWVGSFLLSLVILRIGACVAEAVWGMAGQADRTPLFWYLPLVSIRFFLLSGTGRCNLDDCSFAENTGA